MNLRQPRLGDIQPSLPKEERIVQKAKLAFVVASLADVMDGIVIFFRVNVSDADTGLDELKLVTLAKVARVVQPLWKARHYSNALPALPHGRAYR